MKLRKFSYLFLLSIFGLFGLILPSCSVIIDARSIITNTSTVEVMPEKIELDFTTCNVSKNNTWPLTAYISPITATNQDVTWYSENEAIATVSNEGVVTGVSGGSTYVVAKTVNELTAKCLVNVEDTSLRSISLSRDVVVLGAGGSISIKVAYEPSNASEKGVNWTSSNNDVATVNENGLVTTSIYAKNSDTCIITATSKFNEKIKASCVVTINRKEVNPSTSSTGGSSQNPGTSSSTPGSSIDDPISDVGKTSMGYTYSDYTRYNTYDISSCPSLGSANLLVIPVWFVDSGTKTGLTATTRETVRNDIKKAYFGSNEDTGWRSVKTYYEEESTLNGQNTLTLSGTVSEWYECGSSSSKYYYDTSATTSLVNSAVNWYFSNNPTDKKTNYDCNKDGYLDGVMLIYAYPDYNTEGQAGHSNMWAYCYWLQSGAGTTTSPKPNAFFWASYDFMYGSNKKIGRYYGGNTTYCSIDTHTFVHEMGHIFGLEDYYDYSQQYIPAGGFSMQDFNVGGHDPYSVLALGWSKPYIPEGSCTITLKPFQTSHELILLTPEWNRWNSPFDEYILLEYYTPEGLNQFDVSHGYGSYPAGPNAAGIRIWHIDARLVSFTRTNNYGQPVYEASSLTSNVKASTRYGITHAFSNTYYRSSSDNSSGYLSVLGTSYANYNILQLIRNNVNETYKPVFNRTLSSFLKGSDLFSTGSTFSLNRFSKQFVQGAKLNNGSQLGFNVTIGEMNSSGITVKINAE